MRVAVLEKPGHIHLHEQDVPEPKFGEVRVKLTKTGICGSDVHLFLGDRLLERPTVIGHEGLGFIDKLGEGTHARRIGERVVIEPNIPCKNCRHCLNGNGNFCSNKRVIGVNEQGCFADYICLPEQFCWAIPDEIEDEDAVTIEPMAVAVSALFRSSAKPGDTIAVIGLGAIGLLISHLAVSIGYKVLVTELVESKLRMAVGMGCLAVGGTATDLATAWETHQVSSIFECAGSAHTASLATAAAPRGSEIVLVGLSANPATFTPLKIAREGISILPSIIYHHPTDFSRTIQLIRSGIVSPGFIISSTAPLSDLQKALELAAEGTESKIIVEF